MQGTNRNVKLIPTSAELKSLWLSCMAIATLKVQFLHDVSVYTHELLWHCDTYFQFCSLCSCSALYILTNDSYVLFTCR